MCGERAWLVSSPEHSLTFAGTDRPGLQAPSPHVITRFLAMEHSRRYTCTRGSHTRGTLVQLRAMLGAQRRGAASATKKKNQDVASGIKFAGSFATLHFERARPRSSTGRRQHVAVCCCARFHMVSTSQRDTDSAGATVRRSNDTRLRDALMRVGPCATFRRLCIHPRCLAEYRWRVEEATSHAALTAAAAFTATAVLTAAAAAAAAAADL